MLSLQLERKRRYRGKFKKKKERKWRSDEEIKSFLQTGNLDEELEDQGVSYDDLPSYKPIPLAAIDAEFKPTITDRGRKKIDFVSPEMVVAMNRTKTTNRNAIHLFKETAESHSFDLKNVKLSYGSIYRARRSCTSQIATEKRKNYTSGHPLVIHWDGKILRDIASKLEK